MRGGGGFAAVCAWKPTDRCWRPGRVRWRVAAGLQGPQRPTVGVDG